MDYLLVCEMIDLNLQGQIENKIQNLPHFNLVHAITHHQLKVGSQMWPRNVS